MTFSFVNYLQTVSRIMLLRLLPGAELYIYFPGCFSMFLSPLSPGSELYPEACPAPDALTALVRGGRVQRLGGDGARGGGLTRVLTKLKKL